MKINHSTLRASALVAFFSLFAEARAALDAQGSNLLVTTQSLKASFRAADVVGLSNLITGENYLRSPTSAVLTNLVFSSGAGASLTAGNWSVNNAGGTAALTLTDGIRTVSLTVGIDAASQEIFVRLGGQSTQSGVRQLSWGLTGFDLRLGRIIAPAMGGISIGSASFGSTTSYGFTTSNPTQHWEAPLSLFQTKQGGVAVYARDTNALYRDLTVSSNGQQTANETFGIEAAGPWASATQADVVEWRLAAYSGDWQAGAKIYRDWHNSVAPPVALQGARAWAKAITAVIKFNYTPPYDTAVVDTLAKAVTPSQTLLYLTNWRADNYDVNYPSYTPHASTQALVNRAHQLGFHVMLHTDMIGVSPLNTDFSSVQQFQAKDPANLAALGWNWSLPATTPNRYAYIDPASSTYRKLFVARLTTAIQALNADAIHLDIAGWPPNDGIGLVEGLNYNQGAAQLHQDLLAAFPGMVIGTEGTNDVIAPYGAFVQQLKWPSNFSPDTTPPVPITAYVLPNVIPYGHLSAPNPNEGGFLDYFTQYEGQAVLPTYASGFGAGTLPNYAQPDFARYMKLVTAFQQNGLQPDWDGSWSGAVMRYRGAANSTLTITDDGTIIAATLHQTSGDAIIYQRVHNANQITSNYFIPSWPAYNNTTTVGIDPTRQFWLDSAANDATAVHLNGGLSPGIKLGLGTGTLVTPDFAYFTLLPTAPTAFDFFQSAAAATSGTTYAGVDGSLVNGAGVTFGSQTVGGVTRQSVYTPVPFIGPVGGETFFEYTVSIPSAYGATLSFATGILDNAVGQRKGPMTFKVLVNGVVASQQSVNTGGWVPGSVDLSAFVGQSVALRFIANPGPANDSSFGRAVWSALQLTVFAPTQTTNLNIAIPGALSGSIISEGAFGGLNNGSASVTGVPLNSTTLLFTAKPKAVALKQSLIDLLVRTSQTADGQLAGISTVQGAGAITTASAGGVSKPRALQAFCPLDGQEILSWPVQLPAATSLFLSFSVGLRDGAQVLHGYQMSVRVNGKIMWQYNTGLQSTWKYGVVDLSPWAGQNALVELITDSQGANNSPFVSWAELLVDDSATSAGATTLNVAGPISSPSAGSSGSISITAASDASWSAIAGADWVTVGSSSGTGSATVTYSVAQNRGPGRSTTLAVGGHLLTINQAATAQSDQGRLINLSILTSVAAGEVMTMGTVLGGPGTSGTKPLVARAVGQSLSAFGVTGTLPNPKLALIAAAGGATVASNNGWLGDPTLSNAFAAVGAFPYASSTSKDAGIFQPFLPQGGYTVQVGDSANGSGSVLAELYDASPGSTFAATTTRLINVSVLKTISPGSTLTAGFVVGGATNAKILVRAVGPSLGVAPFNIAGVMAAPKLELFNNASGAKLTENTAWGGDPTLSAAFTAVGAFALASSTSKDAVLLVTLAPGQYSARISANDGGGGTVIVEVYEVP